MFDNSVGSVMILSLIDMGVVFLVLTFLMSVVYVTAWGVKLTRKAPVEAPVCPEPVAGAVELAAPSATAMPGMSAAPDASEDEYELVAVQAAALAAHEAAGGGTGQIVAVQAVVPLVGGPEAQASSPWRHWSLQRGTRPRWK